MNIPDVDKIMVLHNGSNDFYEYIIIHFRCYNKDYGVYDITTSFVSHKRNIGLSHFEVGRVSNVMDKYRRFISSGYSFEKVYDLKTLDISFRHIAGGVIWIDGCFKPRTFMR